MTILVFSPGKPEAEEREFHAAPKELNYILGAEALRYKFAGNGKIVFISGREPGEPCLRVSGGTMFGPVAAMRFGPSGTGSLTSRDIPEVAAMIQKI